MVGIGEGDRGRREEGERRRRLERRSEIRARSGEAGERESGSTGGETDREKQWIGRQEKEEDRRRRRR